MKNLLHYRKWFANLFGILMPLMFMLAPEGKLKAQCAGTVFPAPADILANAPEAANYNLVYKLPIPSTDQVWTSQSQIPYTVNNSAALASSNFTRIAYYMKLQSIYLGVQWVWVSFDKFTSDVSLTSIPTGSTIWQQQVSNMNVVNNSGINKTGITGNVEIWPNCYTPGNANAVPGASDDIFDFGDVPTIDTTCTYGSFQVHDFNAQSTLLSYGGWASSASAIPEDLGVGNFPFGSPDWTFAGNANLYDIKELYVFVNAPGPGTCNNTTISLNASGSASIIPAMVNNAVPGNCGIQSVSLSKSNFTCADLGNNTITVTLTDINNHTTTCTSTVTVRDTIMPVIIATGTTLTLGLNPSAADIEAALGTATVTDNCGTPALNVQTTGFVDGCTSYQIRTWNASDASGNAAFPVTRVVSWTSDATAPVITATGTTLSLGSNPSAADIETALGTATATDDCGAATLTVSTTPVTVTGCVNSQTRTWNAIDAANNASTPVTRTVSWTVDHTAPVIVATGTATNIGYNPSAATINAALGTATATDNCDSPVPTFTDGPVITDACNSRQTRTWNVSDVSGNAATPVSRTVVWKTDATAPVIVAAGTTLSLGLNPSAAAIEAALGTATVTDNCGTPVLTVSTAGVIVSGCSNSQTRTWNATDPSGNPAISVSRVVTWTNDNTAPVIVAAGTTLNAGLNPSAAAIEAALGTATATDNCGTPTVTVATAAVITTGCIKSQTRTWNATDPSGNLAIPVSRVVTWTNDNTAPVIVATGTTLNAGLNPSAAAIEAALGTATATDNCGTATVTVSTGVVITTGCTKSQTRTWNATDPSGNPAVPVSRVVTWTADNTAPVIVATGTTLNLGLNPSAAAIEAALGTATATDNCGLPVLTVSTGTAITTGCIKSQARTWNATDPSGNPAIPVTRTVTWTNDNTAPVIVATGTTLTLGFNPSAATIEAALGTATVSDNCGTPVLTVSTGAVIVTGCVKSQIRTWTAVDPSGNAAIAVTRTVTWSGDNTPPVITATGTTLSLGFYPSSSAINAALGTATATDNCGTPTVTVTNSAITVNGCYKSQTRTWTAVDPSGNTSTVSRTVTWIQDDTPPVITATGTTLTLGCNPSSSAINAALGSATVFENCSFALMIDLTSLVNSNGCSRSQTRSWYAIDLFLNVAATVSRTVTWTADLTPPVINTTGTTLTLACNPSSATIEAALGAATATDNCSLASLTASTGTVTVNSSGLNTQKRTWTALDACGNSSTASRTITWPKQCANGHRAIEEKGMDNVLPDHLVVSLLNNPATTNFSLNIQTTNTNPVTIRIADRFGRTMYTNDKVAPNTTLRVGDNWPGGAYFAEIVQGGERKLVKMIKLN